MRKFYPISGMLLLCLSVLLGSSCARQLIQSESLVVQSNSKSDFKKLDLFDRMDLAMEHEVNITKDPALGYVPRERLLDAFEQLKAEQASRTAISGIVWEERGPSNIGGRTRALMFDRNDTTYNTVFAGAVGGGLWKSTSINSATPNWTQINDLFDNINITTIAQDPSNLNTMYFGTGEGWYNIDALRGFGIFKSTDGGNTWSQLASTTGTDFQYILKIVVDASGNVYATTRNGGLQKSTNGGVSWTKVLGASVSGGSTNEAADIEIAANGDIYCTLGNVFVSSSMFKSIKATHGTNVGNVGNWTAVSLPSGPDYLRIEMGLAPSDTNRLYIIYGDNNTGSSGFATSSDKGASWSTPITPTFCDQGTTTEFTRGQWWYDLVCTVDPNTAGTLYIGGVDLLKSTDFGASWNNVTRWSPAGGCIPVLPNMHADQHAIEFAPGSSSKAVFGNDGGVYFSDNLTAASPSINSRINGYNVTQYYGCDLSPTSGSNNFIAGAQDNGTQKFSYAGVNATTSVTGGDGVLCHIDQDAAATQISSYVYNNYYVTTNTWGSYFSSSTGGGSFINPTDLDDVNNLLYAHYSLGNYRRMTVGTGAWSSSVSYGTTYGTANVIKVSPNVSNRIYIGTNSGKLLRIDAANTGSPTVTSIGSTSFPSGSISCVEVQKDNFSPIEDEHILVSFSNYGVNSVWETNNGSAASPSWTSIEGNLPDMPVRYALFHPTDSNQALLATDLGVWSTTDINAGSTDWDPSNTSFANVAVYMLKHRSSDGLIIAGTHGRGLFSTHAFAPFNYVGFQSASSSFSEATASTGSDCRLYTDLSLAVSITKPGNAAIIANIAVNGSSTATAGVDYDLLTDSLYFPAATSVLTQYVTVRMYNDDLVESAENLILDISSSSPDVSGYSYAQHTISISSDDLLPSASDITLASIGTGSSVSSTTPFRGDYEDERMQLLWTATELSSAGLVAGNIQALAFNVLKFSTGSYSSYTIQMANTAVTTMSSFVTSGFTTVYSSSLTTTSGWNTINFTTPFVWDGTSNVVIQFCFDNATGSGPAGIDYAYGGSTVDCDLYHRLNSASGCSLASNFQNDFRPNVIFTQLLPAAIQTGLNASTADEQYLGPNQSVYFFDDNGNIMAEIQNNSSHDFGCTKVEVSRAGTAATNFWYATPLRQATDKTFKVTPTNPSTTASYTINLYYTQAEINGWMAATSNAITDFDLIKVSNHEFADISPATPYIADVVVDTATAYSTYDGSHYIFTGSFSGFSSFGGGNPGPPPPLLPVELLSFDAEWSEDHVALNWITLTEIDNAGFEIERSLDGNSFSKIGFVAGYGDKLGKSDYVFKDLEQLASVQYYRLKQVDEDGDYSYSPMVAVQMPEVDLIGQLFPNPFSDELNLELLSDDYRKIQIQLFNAEGKMMAELLNSSERTSQWRLKAPANLPSGMYFLKVIMDEHLGFEKLNKQ